MRLFLAIIALSTAPWLALPASAAERSAAPKPAVIQETGQVIGEPGTMSETERGQRDARIRIAEGKVELISYLGGGLMSQDYVDDMSFDFEVSQRVMQSFGIGFEWRRSGCDPDQANSAKQYYSAFNAVMDAHLQQTLGTDYRAGIDAVIATELAVARKARKDNVQGR